MLSIRKPPTHHTAQTTHYIPSYLAKAASLRHGEIIAGARQCDEGGCESTEGNDEDCYGPAEGDVGGTDLGTMQFFQLHNKLEDGPEVFRGVASM